MAEDKVTPAEAEDDNSAVRRGIEDFLEAPRRKKKTFVVIALGRNFSPELANSIHSFFKANYKKIALSQPKTVADFRRLFNRQIAMVVYDDDFSNDYQEGLDAIKDLKIKKKETALPVLFLTRNKDQLIQNYNKTLLAYHESDEYIFYPRAPINQVLNRLKSGMESTSRRRSRRYEVDVPITYHQLSKNSDSKGVLLDLSIHGALLQSEDNQIFRTNEQLKISIPIGRSFNLKEGGEYLHLACRVRRIMISGNKVGVSFEHLTDRQQLFLMHYLTELVNAQLSRQANQMLARLAESS